MSEADPRECGWLGCGHPRCEPTCAAVPVDEWRRWRAEDHDYTRADVLPRHPDRRATMHPRCLVFALLFSAPFWLALVWLVLR